MNMIGRTYVSNQEINKHVLPITITKSREVDLNPILYKVDEDNLVSFLNWTLIFGD